MKKIFVLAIASSLLLGGCISSTDLRGAPAPAKAAIYLGVLSVYAPLQYGYFNTRTGTIAIINESSYPLSVGVVSRFGKMVAVAPGGQQWFSCDVSGSVEADAIARAMLPNGTRTATTSFRLSSWGGKRSFVWILRNEDFGIVPTKGTQSPL